MHPQSSGYTAGPRADSIRPMRHAQALLDPDTILRGTDRGLSLPMHPPSELPTLDLDEEEGVPVRRNWLQRLLHRRPRPLPESAPE